MICSLRTKGSNVRFIQHCIQRRHFPTRALWSIIVQNIKMIPIVLFQLGILGRARYYLVSVCMRNRRTYLSFYMRNTLQCSISAATGKINSLFHWVTRELVNRRPHPVEDNHQLDAVGCVESVKKYTVEHVLCWMRAVACFRSFSSKACAHRTACFRGFSSKTCGR